MKKIAYIFTVIGLCLVINSLIHSIYNLWHKQDLVISAQKKLVLEQQENQKLKAELQYAQTPQFIEEEAHNKLFLVKPGEQEVLFAQKIGEEKQQKTETRPNWQQWLDLFF